MLLCHTSQFLAITFSVWYAVRFPYFLIDSKQGLSFSPFQNEYPEVKGQDQVHFGTYG